MVHRIDKNTKAFEEWFASWRNRLTALGGILGLKPLPEDVTLRVPAAEINQGCAGGFTDPRRVEGTCRESISAAKSVEYPAQRYDDNMLPAMTAMVTGFVDKLAKFYSPCPQGKDCAGDQKHARIFECPHCSFVGCVVCLDLHESAGHENQSSTAREMYSGLRLIDGGKI